MGRISYLKIKCPRCGEIGGLTYRKGVGFCVNHGTKTSHKIRDDEPVEIIYDNPDLSLFKYPGGDTYLLPYLRGMIPPHTCYVEVFGGSGKLLLNKPPSRVEVYNDIDGELVNLFRVVKNREMFRKFMNHLDMVLYSREIFYEYLRKLREGVGDNIERAVYLFYTLNASINGMGKSFSTSRKDNTAKRFFNVVGRLREIHRRLKRVVVENLDFRDVMLKYDSPQTFFYLDPPHLYSSTEKYSYYSARFTDNDYLDLLNLLDKIEGKFLLKQTLSTNYVLNWARERGYRVKTLQLANYMKLDREKRSTLKVVFVANYNL